MTSSNKPLVPLHKHVRICVECYFSDLDGQEPMGLHNRFIAQVEKPLLEVVMAKTKGNQSQAARILGINRNTLRAKLKQYSI